MMRALLATLSLTVAGQALAAEDLAQIYRQALTSDPQYAAARATLEAGQEKRPQGLSALLPSVVGTASTTWNENDIKLGSNPSMRREYNANGWNVQLTQPIFRWDRIAAYRQSGALVAQSEAQFAQARQDLVLRVAQAYFDVLYAQENLTALRAQKVAIAQQLAQAKKSFEVGTATITDTHEAQSRFDLATAQELAAEADLEVKRRALAAIIGREPGDLARLKRDAQLTPPQPQAMTTWVESAQRDNFLVQVQQAGLEVAEREVEKQRAGHLPSLDVVANQGYSAGVTQSYANGMPVAVKSQTDAYNVGLQLTIPIFQGGYVNSKTREAQAQRQAAIANLEGAKRNAALTAQQSYLGVMSGLAQVKAYEAALVSSTSALESNKLGYEVGVRINIDVLNAEQQVYTTTRDLAKSRLDTLVAQLKLKSAVGTLAEEDIDQVNALLEH
ncbi:type I secretion outer membrane protein, TolC family [Oryzomicrobium terrae]|uniref:Type I secretion outer membrane protein, TolC family n=1 Tax=Oryzomicrobium terrae TaxID=1735038 RepID=A0A5C1EBA2_9RHOO|nr:type I secretion outer membrane protein, TolC family [Oryzomicrobium terrae]